MASRSRQTTGIHTITRLTPLATSCSLYHGEWAMVPPCWAHAIQSERGRTLIYYDHQLPIMAPCQTCDGVSLTRISGLRCVVSMLVRRVPNFVFDPEVMSSLATLERSMWFGMALSRNKLFDSGRLTSFFIVGRWMDEADHRSRATVQQRACRCQHATRGGSHP